MSGGVRRAVRCGTLSRNAQVPQRPDGRTENSVRVTPAPADPGLLRRRAERLGHRLRDLAFRDPVAGPAPAAQNPTISPADGPVVQRAVGFEFETGWLVYERSLPPSSVPKGFRPPPPKPLKKKDRVATMRGFKVEADEAAGGLAELEFIVHPPVTVAPDNEDHLDFIMSYIEIFGRDLLKKGLSQEVFGLEEVTGQGGHAKFLIRKGDDELKAGPQVTSGISLEKVAEIGSKKGLPESFARSVMTIGSITASIDEAALDELLPEKGMSAQLRGLLAFLVSVLWGGEQGGLEYPKQITDVFLLGRTDAASMFRLLPTEERETYSRGDGPWKFVRLVLTAAGVPDEGDVPVIVKGVRPHVGAEYTPVGPTRAKWLFFLTQGFDLLSHEVNEEFESMGELGAKTEPVGSQRKEAPIFELRGAQTTKIPLPEWKPFALQTFRFLIGLEED